MAVFEKGSLLHSTDFGTRQVVCPLVDQKNYGLLYYGFCIIRNFPVMQLKLGMDCG